jgi:hypothetical protein
VERKAVCGLPSDDVRIQRYVTQILQVVGTVKKQNESDIGAPFFIQYLIVGYLIGSVPSSVHRFNL